MFLLVKPVVFVGRVVFGLNEDWNFEAIDVTVFNLVFLELTYADDCCTEGTF